MLQAPHLHGMCAQMGPKCCAAGLPRRAAGMDHRPGHPSCVEHSVAWVCLAGFTASVVVAVQPTTAAALRPTTVGLSPHLVLFLAHEETMGPQLQAMLGVGAGAFGGSTWMCCVVCARFVFFCWCAWTC